MAIKKDEIIDLLKKLKIEFPEDSTSEQLETILREHIEKMPAETEGSSNELQDQLDKANSDLEAMKLEYDILKANNELLIAEKEDLKENTAKKPALSSPYTFWAFINNRRSHVSFDSLDKLLDHLSGEFINHYEMFLAKNPDDDSLDGLSKSTICSISKSTL